MRLYRDLDPLSVADPHKKELLGNCSGTPAKKIRNFGSGQCGVVRAAGSSGAAGRRVYQNRRGVGAVLKDHFRALRHLDASHKSE